MVYNAMKLFMEVNPQLFDDCSHDYTENENNKKAIAASRQAKWDHISQLAQERKANGHQNGTSRSAVTGHSAAKATKGPGSKEDEESAGRLERLRLADGAGAVR